MSVKQSRWVPKDDYSVMQKACERVVENIHKMDVAVQLCVEEFREDGNGLTAHHILELIRDFLKGDPNEVNTYIFLHLLAYYPNSMTSYNLTPLMQRLIAISYYYCKNTKGIKLSMDDLAEIFHRSKSTIHDAVQKHHFIEKMLKAEAEEERLRRKAKEVAFKQLIEEEKQKLKESKENSRKIGQINEQT